MDLPQILIVGSMYDKIINVIEKLGAKLYLNQDNISYFILKIDNKYYTAEILLCVLKHLSELSTDAMEGLIICEDLQENYDLKLKQWTSVIDSLSDAEVRLLICDNVTENSDKDRVLEWCTQNRFELVELECLDPSELQDLELEHNTFGVTRITEALHAHKWPNISLKDKSSNSTNSKADVNTVSEDVKNINLNSSNVSERLQIDSVLDGLMGNEDTDFGELFGQLRAMKEHAMSLPLNERKNAAELLVMAFWKAMGGNELDEFS